MLNSILTARHYAFNATKADKSNAAYYNAYLLANFGIVVDKPEYVNKEVVSKIATSYKLTVPASFYANPQDTRFYSREELLVEQIVSYFLAYGDTMGNSHINVFAKDLPEYAQGDELVLREFTVLTTEAELTAVLKEITANYCDYTRPFGLDELAEFKWLFTNGYYENQYVACKDNAISMLDLDISFARFLDKKDLVKMSVARLGDKSTLVVDADTRKFYKACLSYVHDCPLSKKQAKYFNKVCQAAGVKAKKATNVASPYRLAKVELDAGNVLGAAKIYAANGSLLERNVKMLLSRANPMEAVEILNMLPAKNPIALYQMVNALGEDTGAARTFAFTRNNKVHKHIETDYEKRWRKSVLNESTRKCLHDACFDKIDSYYSSLESLGKVYVADNFYHLGVPTNTSAGGKGIDVLPAGSRVALTATKVRTFVYWKDAFDIDSSVTLIRADGTQEYAGWWNWSRTAHNDCIRFSGDCTACDGAEYYDLDLDLLRKHGYIAVLFHFNGYRSRLDRGEIYCGYQAKEDFNTAAWDPKNITMQIHVHGDSRAALGFALDLRSNEFVVINQMIASEDRVMSPEDVKVAKKFLEGNFLELNIGRIASHRGELVSSPEEADYVFDDAYKPAEGQTVVRSYELEKLVSIANA